jgi:purine nucleosidase
MHPWIVSSLVIALLAGTDMAVAAPQKVILDTDIGDDVDDAYALALLASLPDVKIVGVTTAFGETTKRAELAAKLLKTLGKGGVPVCAGRQGDHKIGRQYGWAKGFPSSAIRSVGAAEFIRREVERAPGEITLIAIGPLTNLGDLLTRYPEVKTKIGRIVLMGGAVYVGYNNQAPATQEWNIRCDPAAAHAVFTSGVPLTMAGLEVTTMLQLDAERQKRLFAYGTPVTDALAALTNLWGNVTPTLFDPMAVAYATGHVFCESEQRLVMVEDDGQTRVAEGTPNATVLVKPQKDAFLDWYVGALAPTAPSPRPRER